MSVAVHGKVQIRLRELQLFTLNSLLMCKQQFQLRVNSIDGKKLSMESNEYKYFNLKVN